MRVRGIVVTVLIAAFGLIAVGAGTGTDPPPVVVPSPVLVAAPTLVAYDTEARESVVDVDAVVAYLAAVEVERLAVEQYLQAEADRVEREHQDALRASRSANPPAVVARGPVSTAPPGGSCNGDFDCFKPCTFAHESGGNYQIVSPGGTYRGAWQFDQGTWNNAVANAGYPEWVGRPANEAPPEIQDAAAAWLYSMRGNQPWGGRC